MKKIVCCIILVAFSLVLAKPMESIERYNIILVHGAADSLQGIDCSSNAPEKPFDYWEFKNNADTLKRIEGYVRYSLLGEKTTSNATGMIKTLTRWIAQKILDDDVKDRRSIYLNRPFINPANSPIINGVEIGNRAWMGKDKCKIRRSLTEEVDHAGV